MRDTLSKPKAEPEEGPARFNKRRLVRIMQDVEKGGVVRDDKDKKALVEARELSERTLSNLAVNWHNEAKKTRDDATFGFADIVYGDYLTLFPDNPKAYDLRFF